MEILFLILKVLGIFLAVLLLLGIVFLSVPVRYGFNIKVQDEVEGNAVVHWLLHLVDVRICYRQKDVSIRLRILGIPISLNKEKKEATSSEEKEYSSLPEKIQKDAQDSAQTGQKELSVDLDMLPSEEKHTEQNRKKKGNRKQSFRHRMKAGTSGVKRGFRDLGQRVQDVRNGTTTVKEQIENIKNMILEETNQNAFRYLLGEFRYLLRHYSPKKIYGTVRFAMGNPDQTGRVLGAISLFPGWSRYKIVVMPDFASDAFYLKGNLSIRGHIRVLHILVSGFRLIKNKNIRQLITNIRK